MKTRLSTMILAQPAGFQRHAARLIPAVGKSDKNLPQSCQALRKISEDFSGDFALIAARPKNARNQDPAWSFSAQWEVGQLRCSRKSMTAKQSIFKNFQREPLAQLHTRRAEQRSNRLGRAPLPPDHLAQILRLN